MRLSYSRPVRVVAFVLLGVLLLGLGLLAGAWLRLPRLTEAEVQSAVVSTIQREAPASIYITGVIDATATATVVNTKYLLPELFRLDLGSTEATVRLPGRVYYGFDVRALRPEMIRLAEDGVVEVTIPPLAVQTVEPDLSAMEVKTSVGWARLHARSGQEVEQQAMEVAQRALREQGNGHLERSAQPRIYAAEALETLLTPVLQAAGMDEPTFRFQIGPELVMQPGE